MRLSVGLELLLLALVSTNLVAAADKQHFLRQGKAATHENVKSPKYTVTHGSLKKEDESLQKEDESYWNRLMQQTANSVELCNNGTIRAEYKLPAEIDPRIMEEYATELWAEVTRPCELSATPLPLLLFMHGYHDTCGFTREDGLRVDLEDDNYGETGNCSDPTAPEVVPQHQGYRYVADVLGEQGFVVVSINTNRGLIGPPTPEDDPAGIMARGRLFLKHIEQLAKWNSGQEEAPEELEQLIPLKDQINFDNIGLMGHSRGGAAARAAVYQYKMPNSTWPESIGPPANFKAIYELAPDDGSVPNITLNATGLAWYVVLASCDGDLFDHNGMKVFDRTFNPDVNDTEELPKGSLLIAGADHAGFNTEWQSSESKGCIGVDPLFNPEIIMNNSHIANVEKEIKAEVASPNPDQQRIVLLTMVPFFRMALMGELSEGRFMNPAYPLPDDFTSITFYERGYLRAPPQHRFETGLQTTGVRVFDPTRGDVLVEATEMVGVILQQSNLAKDFGPVHEQGMKMSKVFWVEAPSKYVTLLFSATEGVRTESIKTLAFRVALGCGKHFCDTDVSQVPAVSVSVCLVVLEGETLVESTEVNLNSLVTLRRPTGPIITESRLDSTWYPPSVLQTVAVPMDRFLLESDLDLSTIHGIRIKIETEYPGELYLGQIIADDKDWSGGN